MNLIINLFLVLSVKTHSGQIFLYLIHLMIRRILTVTVNRYTDRYHFRASALGPISFRVTLNGVFVLLNAISSPVIMDNKFTFQRVILMMRKVAPGVISFWVVLSLLLLLFVCACSQRLAVANCSSRMCVCVHARWRPPKTKVDYCSLQNYTEGQAGQRWCCRLIPSVVILYSVITRSTEMYYYYVPQMMSFMKIEAYNMIGR